jgi:hypothetical protein
MRAPLLPVKPLITLCLAAVLAGCASIANVPAGTPYKEVVKQFGNPAVSCPAPNGGTRMVWSQEPSGEEAWSTVVGSNKLTTPFQQMLRKGMFTQISQGTWTAGQIRCAFGPPAKTQVFPDKPNQIVWEYRYMGDGNDEDFMMLYISLDIASNSVVGYSTGPDPELNPEVIGGN